jgi:hypothetical protein
MFSSQYKSGAKQRSHLIIIVIIINRLTYLLNKHSKMSKQYVPPQPLVEKNCTTTTMATYNNEIGHKHSNSHRTMMVPSTAYSYDGGSTGDSTPPTRHVRGVSPPSEGKFHPAIDEEWTRLEVAKKRVALQEEHLQLEQKMLKAEKKNLKRNAKLSEQQTLTAQLEIEKQKTVLTQQMVELEKKQADFEERLALEGNGHSSRSRHDSDFEEVSNQLQMCQKDLQATQASLAKLFLERDSLRREKEKVQEQLVVMESKLSAEQERDATAATIATAAATIPTSVPPTTERHDVSRDCERLSLQVSQLEEDLHSMKNVYALAMAEHAEEKRRWMEEQQQQLYQPQGNDTTIAARQKLGGPISFISTEYVQELQDLLKQYEDENEALRQENRDMQRRSPFGSKSSAAFDGDDNADDDANTSDNLTSALQVANDQLESMRLAWQEEKDLFQSQQLQQEQQYKNEKQELERQLQQQNKEMDNWKLLLPRNKVLLEQTQAKNEHLKGQLNDARNHEREQNTKLKELEAEKERLVQQLQEQSHDHEGEKEFVNENGNTIASIQPGSITLDHYTSALDPAATSSTVVIPLDFTHEELMAFNMEKKFELEFEWTNHYGGRGGKYTGWLNLGGDPDGYGTLRIDDGSIYTGSWVQGRRSGYGVYTSLDGLLFAGQWSNNVYHGRGVEISETNDIFTGDWADGKRHGKGIASCEKGTRYVGEFDRNKRSGKWPTACRTH